MKPMHLQLTNFLSYREKVDVDLSAIHLACISGQNGAGKSTLLDAITWALFGKARRTDDAIIFSGSEMAEVVFDFEYEGELYRISRRKHRTKPGTMDLFIQYPEEDGSLSWKPISEKSITTTEDRVVKILRMDYDTFINASFFLQGKADEFTQKNATERKKILSSILGLDRWDAYAKKAAEKRKKLEEDQRSIDIRTAEIDVELGEEADRKQKYEELDMKLQQFGSQKKMQEDSLAQLRTLHSLQQEAKKQLENNETMLTAKRRNFESTGSRLAGRRAELDEMSQIIARADQINLDYHAWQETRSTLEGLEKLAFQYHQLIEQKTAPMLALQKIEAELQQEQKTLQEKKESAERSLTERPGIITALEQGLQAIAAIEDQLGVRNEFEQQCEQLRAQREDLSAENKKLKADMDHLHARRVNLETTDEASCPFCGQDLTSEHRLELLTDIQNEGTQLGDQYRENQARLADLEKQLSDLDVKLQGLTRLESEKQDLLRKTDVFQARLSASEPELQIWETTAKKRLAEVGNLLATADYAQNERGLLSRLDEEIWHLGYDTNTHELLRKQELAQRQADADHQQLEKTRSAFIPLQREINDLIKQQEIDKLELEQMESSEKIAREEYQSKFASLPDLNLAELEFRRLIEQESSLRDEVWGARQKVEVLVIRKAKRKELEQQREQAGILIGQFKQLELTFGKNGVPALLIEQAIPDIENEANNLLDRLSGGEMSIHFRTQQGYKDKSREDLKETLEIEITDGTGTRAYEMFSGGEAFRVNFAIRLALSRILAQRSGARLQTLVIDEGFGSQDAFGRERLVEAINLVQNDFARILVITHLEELKDRFPSRIEVEKTESGSTVKVISNKA